MGGNESALSRCFASSCEINNTLKTLQKHYSNAASMQNVFKNGGFLKNVTQTLSLDFLYYIYFL